MMRLIFILATLLASIAAVGAADPAGSKEPAPRAPAKIPSEELPNAYRITGKVISGGLPESDAAFKELADLGVQTIIDVDGISPDLEAAAKYHMRYVHLPHGYDGIPAERAKQLAKAVHDLPGPIYIHCHHGKHRSPAAAAVACVGAGLIEPADAERILKTAGTSPNYKGLYDAARSARPLGEDALAALPADFPEKTAIPPLAEAMVEVDHTHHLLKQLSENQWRPTKKHPDADASHEALLLKEHFAELLRMDEVQQRPLHFVDLLKEAEADAASLEGALRDSSKTKDAAALFEKITKNCATCHREYRDAASSK
jgi:hypothetical protein